jgi:hypothetical protein
LYFVSRRYIAAVEPIPGTTEAQQVVFSSPILQNPDDNDVRMFNPDDNYSISIRRSSIRPSRQSQIEQSIIALSPVTSPVTSPNNAAIVPTITYSDITPSAERDDLTYYSPKSVPTSPVSRKPSTTPSSYTARSSTNGLGISVPSDKPPLYTQTNKLLVPPPVSNNNVSPDLPLSTNLSVPDIQSLEITTLAHPGSPTRPVRASFLGSALSFKSSSMVIPEEDEKSQETLPPPMSSEALAHQQTRFIAFHPKPWLNPFYLAIFSCSVLSISILFMIVFDLTMLGLGTDVFG